MAESSDPRLVDLEIERSRLECQKLQVEIEQIRQPFWKRAGYIASMSPIILALVAFLSAWITGYFNTERQQLESDIAELETRRTALMTEADAMQQSIDIIYLKLKRAAGEAGYAVGHLHALDADGEWAETVNRVVEQNILVDDTKLGEALKWREDLIKTIISATEEELGGIDQTLSEVPASNWAQVLFYEPGPLDTLSAPDGRLYKIETGLYFDDYEAVDANRPSANQSHPGRPQQ